MYVCVCYQQGRQVIPAIRFFYWHGKGIVLGYLVLCSHTKSGMWGSLFWGVTCTKTISVQENTLGITLYAFLMKREDVVLVLHCSYGKSCMLNLLIRNYSFNMINVKKSRTSD